MAPAPGVDHDLALAGPEQPERDPDQLGVARTEPPEVAGRAITCPSADAGVEDHAAVDVHESRRPDRPVLQERTENGREPVRAHVDGMAVLPHPGPLPPLGPDSVWTLVCVLWSRPQRGPVLAGKNACPSAAGRPPGIGALM